MFIDVIPSSPGAGRSLEALDAAVVSLRDLGLRLGDVAARLDPIVGGARWEAPSARVFHDRLDQWRAALVAVAGRADDLADTVARARAELQVRAWAEVR